MAIFPSLQTALKMTEKRGCHVSFLPHLKQAIKTSQHGRRMSSTS
jgi:hypothetical protein